MDDSFVMLAAWRRTRVQDDVRIRMAETFSGAAVSITITSVTDVLSFWVGAFTNFKSVQIFSIYTGTAVVMLYIYHITFFGACMAISGFREAQNRHALLGIRVKPKSEAHNHSLLYRVLCAGGISTTKPYEVEDNKDHAVMLFCRNVIAKNLNKVFFKVLVLLVFALYISVALWGLITHSKEGLERSRLSREDSYSVAYYNVEEKYFRRYPYRVQVVISGDYNYSDPKIRDEVESVISQMENTTYVAESLFTDSWLREFMPLVESNKLWYDINIDTEEDFIYNLEDLFLNSPSNPFYQDVVFNENRTRIIATRYVLQITNLGFIHEDTWMMQELRDICDRSFLNVTVFQPFFIFFDQFLVVADTTINAVVVAGVIMILVSLVFIPNPCCAIWVGFSIISIEVGVMGYMSLWGVSFDAISMINLIMCIGFSVDFSAHISYAYLSAKVNTPAERVEAALHDLGMPILQGSVSTVLGIIALSFAPSYIFVTFFKTIFLVMFFGACHGLFLLPVLLSLFGPASCSSKHHHEKDDDKERADPDPQLGASNYGFDYGIDLVAMPVEGGTSNGRISVVGTPAFDLTTPRTESGADSGERHTIQRQISPESDKDEGIVTSGDSSQQSSIGKTQGERFSQEAAVQRCRQLETPLKRRHPKRRHSVATETQRSPLPLFPFSPHRPAYRAQLSEFFPRESLSALPPLQTNIHNGGAEQSKREKRSSSSNRSSKHKPPATGGKRKSALPVAAFANPIFRKDEISRL
ncbi:unnamed protein product [Cyprideis torosa]|uniref:Uncharacterized protein n=1 Tax=Cyprideis torosa TaxID=163714 RepID=A0A7R8ZN68_9CRUS|nr:unnamed protein product [Cyprideis torosa]CAG0887174.1 unnamed protein product [Cyprideis torosa]